MKRVPMLTLVALITTVFVSCGGSKTDLAIPKDVSMVVHIDAGSLTSKLKWEEIKATEWFRDAAEKEHDSLTRNIMENPSVSGVDVKSDFVVFLKKQGHFNYIVFEGKLKDADAFENMVKQKGKSAKVEKNGSLSYIKQDGNLVSWNSSHFILSSLSPISSMPLSQMGTSYEDRERASSDSLLAFTKGLLDISKENSLESDKRFTDLLKEKGDAHFWLNMESYTDAFPDDVGDEALSTLLSSFQELYRGTISTGVINFEDGRIAMKSKQYVGERMKAILEKHKAQPVTAELVNRIPSDSAAMVIAASYPPELSMEILKTTGLVPILNGFLKKYNYSITELMQAVKGQFVLALTDFSVTTVNRTDPESGYAYPVMQPNVSALLAMSVNNKASIDKLVGIAQSQMDSAQQSFLFSKIVYRSTNDWLTISTTPQVADQFIAGGNRKLHFAEKISGHPFGMYMDLRKIISGASSFISRGQARENTPGIFQDIIATGGDYKDGVTTGEFVINLSDKSTNALKQFNNYAEQTYREQKKRREGMQMDYPKDSTVQPFPPPVN